MQDRAGLKCFSGRGQLRQVLFSLEYVVANGKHFRKRHQVQ